MLPSIKIIVAGGSGFSPPLALLLISQVYKAFFSSDFDSYQYGKKKKVNIDLVGEKTEASKRLIVWNERAVSILSSLRGIMCWFLANEKVD